MGYIQPRVASAVIPISTADSAEIEISGPYTMFAVFLPAAFDGTALAVKSSATRGGTKAQLYDSAGNAVILVVAAGHVVGITGAFADAIASCQFICLSSNNGGGETAARTLQLSMK